MNRPLLRFAVAALIVVLGIWSGAHLYSKRAAARLHGPGIAVPVGEASAPTASDFLPGFDASLSPPVKIPDRLPDFSLRDRDGKATSIKAWSGKSLVINFWATWCAPCRREIPLLKTLHSEWAARDVAVVGIAVDHRDQVLAYAQQLGIPYPLLIGEQDALDVAAAFGVESPAFPFTVFTDRRGEVVALYLGELHKAQADLILGVVQTLNQDQVGLPEARRTIADGLQALRGPSPG
jgi:peroxiredoxin